MRDPERLDNIYETMLKDHKEKLPDWRMGQLWSNFLGIVYSKTGRDPFYIEDAEFLKQWNDFIANLKH
jgi:hypothetical protein